ASVASCVTDAWVAADHDSSGAFYHRILLRAKARRSPRPTIENRRDYYGSGCFAARGERSARWPFLVLGSLCFVLGPKAKNQVQSTKYKALSTTYDCCLLTITSVMSS